MSPSEANAIIDRIERDAQPSRREAGLFHELDQLGVDAETLDTYNREIPINVRHCFTEKPISWRNLNDLPLSLDIAGTFLEIETGKRYPAKREIAQKLLAQKHSLTYKRQDVNFYSYGDLPLQIPYPRMAQPIPAAPQTSYRRNGDDAFSSSARTSRNRYENGAVDATPTMQPVPLPLSEPLIFRDDTAAQNRLAERVYKTIQQLNSDPSRHMSKANAQRLVETYGIAAVDKALKRMTWYAGKGRVERPAGYLITTSRLAWRELNHATGIGAPAPRFRSVRKL